MPELYLNTRSKANSTYDAIVIGSGITGGWAAKELCEKGLKVIMMERGGDYKHIRDYKSPNPWELEHRGKRMQADAVDKIDISGWMAGEATSKSWVGNEEHPYTEEKPFKWVRTYRLGGRSTMWSRQCYRWSDLDFEANGKEGIGSDWPIRYKDLASWYDYAELFAGINGSIENIPHLPDGKFLPPMQLNIVEKAAKKALEATFSNRKLIIGRSANLTAPLPGRGSCQYRNRCWEGCQFGAYFSTQSSTLPAAVKTNNLTISVNSIVSSILYDKDTKKAIGVEIVDTTNNQTYEYYAKIVFVCASALNSNYVLMNSANNVWENGLGSSSGELGHGIMDHHYNIGANGAFDGYEEFTTYGGRPNGIYIPRFANVGSDKRDYLRGFGYQGGAGRGGWARGTNEAGLGVDFKESISRPGQWHMGITGFGEVLPDHANRVYLDNSKKDKYGLPYLVADCELKENELKMRVDIKTEAQVMLEAAGCTNVKSYDGGHDMGHGIHEMGGARMGRDAKTSVLNMHNQIWDAKNVFVTDGACMASSACVNPSLTYMALTARAANFAFEELKKQNL